MKWQVIGASVVLVLALATISFCQLPASPAGTQSGPVGNAAREPSRDVPTLPKATPRRENGKPILGTIHGEAALWLPASGGAERLVDLDSAAPSPDKMRVSDMPLQPWARAVYEYRGANQLEPHTRCKPSGGPRQFLTPYGVEILEVPDLQRIFIIDIGGPHTYRVIYMDGRSHPKDVQPSFYGDSIGHWEGDTLVIDTIGFNEKFWMDRQGVPHTEKLHMVEKLTRTDYNTMKYQVTLDDPGAYTHPWTSGFNLRWTPNSELFEYVCQDNNYAPNLMVGSQEYVDRSSKIVP